VFFGENTSDFVAVKCEENDMALLSFLMKDGV
jgi:hypothetical protein